MGARLAHRGPDDSGIWWDQSRRVGLSHRRLSIVDLTAAGRQPMASGSGRFVIAFNGEIYNAQDLRGQLERRAVQQWRGQSDTEVALAAFEAWGIDGALERFRGMFAMALLDVHGGALHLIRDHAGKKPLYYGWVGGVFAFASELAGLAPLAGGRMGVDPSALVSLLDLGYIPSTQCIHPGVHKVQAGEIASIRLDGLAMNGMPSRERWWDAAGVAQKCAAQGLVASGRSLLDGLEQVMTRAVAMRLRADVPVGAFLSGGVDSAIVVALMAREMSSRLETFTVAFDDSAFDESAAAARVAAAVGASHNVLRLDEGRAQEVASDLATIYDEPFADSSQIPLVALSRFARQGVAVALCGDGGDELLGGYDRYVAGPRIWRAIRFMPQPIRAALAASARGCAAHSWSRALAGMVALGKARRGRMGEKLERLGAALESRSLAQLVWSLESIGNPAGGLVAGSKWSAPAERPQFATGSRDDLALAMMQHDFREYLCDDLLVKVDRASMSVALEVRSPFLDRDVVEWCWRLPASARIMGTRGKVLARQLADRLVPGEHAHAPKMGLGVPLAAWLRGGLRDWAQDLLSIDRLKHDGHFNPSRVRELWEAFLDPRTPSSHLAHHRIWAILMFQSWNDRR